MYMKEVEARWPAYKTQIAVIWKKLSVQKEWYGIPYDSEPHYPDQQLRFRWSTPVNERS